MKKINLERCENELNSLIDFLTQNYFSDVEMKAYAKVSMTYKKQRLRPYYVFEDNDFYIKYPAVMLIEDLNIRQLVNFTFHELSHIYSRIKGYPATSRKEMYHNKYFSFIAEKCNFGVSVQLENDEQHIGYADTQISNPAWEKDKEFYQSLNLLLEEEKEEIMKAVIEVEEYNKEKSFFSYVKYQCPDCKKTAYAAKGMEFICKKCNKEMQHIVA